MDTNQEFVEDLLNSKHLDAIQLRMLKPNFETLESTKREIEWFSKEWLDILFRKRSYITINRTKKWSLSEQSELPTVPDGNGWNIPFLWQIVYKRILGLQKFVHTVMLILN